MYIIQIADLHIGSQKNISKSEHDLMLSAIEEMKKIIPQNELIIISVGGDIVDSANVNDEQPTKANISERYEKAGEILKLIRQELTDYTCYFKFCIGNHDITHKEEFYKLVQSFQPEVTQDELLSTYAYGVPNEDTNFIFTNSCHNDRYEHGGIKYEELEKCLEENKSKANANILFLHHTLISMDEEDKSPIINTKRLIQLIEKYNIIAVFHGHTHGRSSARIGANSCKIIGTGALFSRDNPDVNSQFIICEYKSGEFLKMINVHYEADANGWNQKPMLIDDPNYFQANSFSSVYSKLMSKLSAVTPLYDVILNVNTTYDEFEKDLNNNFKNKGFKIGNREFTYKQLAEYWEQDEVPLELYFNHGKFFKKSGQPGWKFVAEILKSKKTSNRAVLTTYGMEDVAASIKDEKNYLPSLEHIQFSYDDSNNILYAHMYFRALEASRFLNINICEMDYLLDKLKKEGISFNIIHITISAFRVQAQQEFSCFIKSKLDQMDKGELGVKVGKSSNKGTIAELLSEKASSTETITHSEGIRNLFETMIYANKDADEEIYNSSIIKLGNDIIEQYSILDEIHQRTSVRQNEEQYEKNIKKLIQEVIEQLNCKG